MTRSMPTTGWASPPMRAIFAVAAQMLKALRVPAIRLMTNNPEKQAVLASLGVEIAERLPLQIEANPHNARYLVTKRDRTGHQL